jgi:hypothetical protein
MNLKFIIATNEDVQITGLKSDRRRRIYVELDKNDQYIDDFHARFQKEAPLFLAYCKSEYARNYPRRSAPIKVEDSVEDELEISGNEFFEMFVEQYCKTPGEIKRATLQMLFTNKCSRRREDWKRFKKYLRDHLGVKEDRVGGQWVLKNITIRGHVIVPALPENVTEMRQY